jgi:5'-nucleotidase
MLPKTLLQWTRALAILVATLLASCSDAPPVVEVKLIAFNDFHGYVLPPPDFELRLTDPDGGPSVSAAVGGAAYLATLVKELKAQNPNSMLVGVGDLVGGSPAVSAWTKDEATVEVLSKMGVEISPVGNHEFDQGKDELKRLQYGGCAPPDPKDSNIKSCALGPFAGASYKYLAANVTDQATGALLFPATHIRRFGSASVGFIGLTLKDTPDTTRGAGGLSFEDEVPVIERHATELRRSGVDAVVVLLHQGGGTTAKSINDKTCPNLTGPVRGIVEKLSRNIDVVLSAHTHKEYVCDINGILLTQAGYYGNMVADVSLTIVPGRGVVAKSATSVPVIRSSSTGSVPRGYRIVKPDPEIEALVQRYDDLSKPARASEIGFIAATLDRFDDANGTRIDVADHPLGRLMADSYLAAAPAGQPADIAFVNPGGIRSPALSYGTTGKVTYDDLFAVSPFANELYSIDLTGEALLRLLEQQWEAANCAAKRFKDMCGRVLQPSSSLTYTWQFNADSMGKPGGTGSVVKVDSIRINGAPLELAKTYRVIAPAFLAAEGGDYFTVFTERGTNPRNITTTDLDALRTYVAKYPASNPYPAPALRVTCEGCQPFTP